MSYFVEYNSQKKRLSNLCNLALYDNVTGTSSLTVAAVRGIKPDGSNSQVKRNQQIAQYAKLPDGNFDRRKNISGYQLEADGTTMNNFDWTAGRVWPLGSQTGRAWGIPDTQAIASWPLSPPPGGTYTPQISYISIKRDSDERQVSISLK